MGATKKRKRLARLYTDVTRKRFWLVKFTDAEKAIETPIHFAPKLIKKARKGVPFECVLAYGIETFAEMHPSLFPHEVLHVYVLKRVIYIVDKMNGMPIHAVRYWHNFGNLANAFDTITKQQFSERFGDEGFTLRLRPAKKRGGNELTGARETRRKPRERIAGGNPAISRGAFERARLAGLEVGPSPAV